MRACGSSSNSVLNRLETAGLVERQRPCGDRRSACVGLTPAGRTQAPHLRQILVELDVRVYAYLPPDQLALVRRGLNSIQFAVDQAPETPVAQPVKIPA
ncbi:MAG: winged helix DNA-binding protein [Acidobacteria bacterium]|nr:winged helix DNA-binding protein [Acidobacteriota bacterium]